MVQRARKARPALGASWAVAVALHQCDLPLRPDLKRCWILERVSGLCLRLVNAFAAEAPGHSLLTRACAVGAQHLRAVADSPCMHTIISTTHNLQAEVSATSTSQSSKLQHADHKLVWVLCHELTETQTCSVKPAALLEVQTQATTGT